MHSSPRASSCRCRTPLSYYTAWLRQQGMAQLGNDAWAITIFHICQPGVKMKWQLAQESCAFRGLLGRPSLCIIQIQRRGRNLALKFSS